MQPQKDFPQYLSEIEANCHGDGVDLVARRALEPVAGADLAVVFDMADNWFDGIASFLSLSFGRGNTPLLSSQNNFHVFVL